MNRPAIRVVLARLAAALCLEAACAPTVPQDLPNETIAINMNTKIDPEVRARVEQELDELLSAEKDLF